MPSTTARFPGGPYRCRPRRSAVGDADRPARITKHCTSHLDDGVVDETLGVILKVEEDVHAVRGATARGYLAEVQARG